MALLNSDENLFCYGNTAMPRGSSFTTALFRGGCMRKSQRRVLLALGWYDYRLHRGIEKFAQEHGWYLSANLTREKVIPWGWEGDGILAWLGAGDDLAEFVKRAKRPTVDFSFRRPYLSFARVLEDHAHAARMILQNAGEGQIWPAEAEINRGPFCAFDEFRQIIAGSQPRENPISFPAP